MRYEARFTNLPAFLSSLGRARSRMGSETPAELEGAVRQIALPRAKDRAPRRSGHLASTGKVERKGDVVVLSFSAPYARGAEKGRLGKWSGFARYGPAGRRFVGSTAQETRAPIAKRVTERLRSVWGFGWFR